MVLSPWREFRSGSRKKEVTNRVNKPAVAQPMEKIQPEKKATPASPIKIYGRPLTGYRKMHNLKPGVRYRLRYTVLTVNLEP